MESGIIRPSKSPWRSPIVIAPKKGERGRFCVDFRRLNDVTVRDAYPMPRVEDLINALHGASYFSKMDAESGYHQIDMDPRDIEKTAFACREGLFEFTKMPFGLVNAPATFQRTMDMVLKPFLYKFVIVYMDDILIYSRSLEEHKEHLREVRRKLEEVGLRLNVKKCEYGKREIKILGHTISGGCVKVDEEKVKTIRSLPVPDTRKKLQSFLGLFNYCTKHIKDSYKLTAELYAVLKLKDKAEVAFWACSEKETEYVKSIEKCKKALEEAAILTIPDLNEKFTLTTDASKEGIGAVLSQVIDGEEKIVCYYGALKNMAERNYSTTEQELLAVIKAIQHFREYLVVQKFELRTDHKALTYLFKSRNMKARLARWSLLIQEYDFDITYIKGEVNFTDHLSREFEGTCLAVRKEELTVKELSDLRAKEILIYYHDLLGHGSAGSLKYAVSSKYTWKNRNKDIAEFVRNCRICQQESSLNEKQDNVVIGSKEKGELWEVDIVGPFKDSERGCKYILTMIDHCTKISEVSALVTKDMETVVRLVHRYITRKHGAPKSILSDNGREFKNRLTQEYAQRWGINWKFGSPYCPTT
ncbi:MAG: reverse transcriptase domain-containing protein, partial [Clostridium sp.]|uniref:reverse transcriptase domain-containing protein n=1 Tax=Clostridium sp. TaxID=1506 RepID=UPI003F4129C7